AAEAFKLGVADYLVKPFDIAPTLALLRRTLTEQPTAPGRPDGREVGAPPPTTGGLGDDLIGRSPPMQQLRTLIRRAAATEATVLISGETGVGKDLVARALHQHSRRGTGPFVPINAAAIPASLAESMLFGYEPGAFTGAATRHRGVFERAQGGTLFLDEV